MAPPPVILTTDFGLSDPYAGVMKGVVLSINPAATLIDLTHNIQPQNIRQGSFVLAASHRFFPPKSIHVAVVDPGVGTDRMAILLVTSEASFLAPDNGLLSGVLKDYLDTPPPNSSRVPLPPSLNAYQLTNSEYWLHPVSNTFHGRDIFSPVAAHLSLGVPPEAFGQPLQDLAWLPTPTPTRENDCLTGEVIYADHYGNLVTNIPLEALAKGTEIIVEIKGRKIVGLSKTFQLPANSSEERLLALGGSLGYLEIAVQNGSAATLMNAGPGEAVRVFQTGL
ncbi:MAG: S-adenosyl-l-methionine hydroxide adenosyltransferase [Planctomyces sp.]|nr:S-adenosyl-l-methionine hydroxide adenosyltransferase [Planctomyces sp.]